MTVQGKNILVAGATGLIGANLARRLKEMGACLRATCFSRSQEGLEKFDFTEMDACLEATRDMQSVFICAAQTFGAKVMKENPAALVGPNLRINAGLLEACRVNRVEKIVFISSSTVYQEAFHPVREDELDLNKPVYDLYLGVGGMKRYCEQLALFYSKACGMKIGIVRPSNIYGPHDKFDEAKSHVLPALILRALKKEDPFVVWGDGHTVRDFLYVDDFTEDLVAILERHCVADPVNVASGKAITIREAVKIILSACGHKARPVYDETKPNAIPYRQLDTTKFEALFGKRERTPFEEGIRRSVAWYQSTL